VVGEAVRRPRPSPPDRQGLSESSALWRRGQARITGLG
jgi:hypothetical protein